MKLDPRTIQAVVFDCVNTVFDVSHIEREELSKYVEQVRRPVWEPLVLPQGWVECRAHADSAEGINRISKEYVTATCSNWPAQTLAWLSSKAGIDWGAIIPMETVRVYKPNPLAYLNVVDVLGQKPSQVLLVTANESAPDLSAARALGMQSILIDRKHEHADGPKTIIELAEMLDA